MCSRSGHFTASRLADDREDDVSSDLPSTEHSAADAGTLHASSLSSVDGHADPDLEVGSSSAAECVICLNELDGEAETTLPCSHKFHASCIREWLETNGKCPVCRRVINEQVVARAAAREGATTAMLDPRIAVVLASGAAMENTHMLLTESRRLMMFATMQAALSVLVMSYVYDMVSPPLMLLSSCFTFVGASQFSLRVAALCRPLLCLNVMYHLYLLARLVHYNDGSQLFALEYPNTRAMLLSLGCVAVLEAVALKKVGFFYFRLLASSELDLQRVRRLRNSQVGWAQRVVIFVMFFFICTPIFAKYLCLTKATHLPREVCSAP